MGQPLNERFRAIMLDLETFGTGTNAAVVSIGACAFNIETGEVNDVDVFHARIDLSKSRSPGVIDASTVEWWMRQNEEARMELLSGMRFTLEDALTMAGPIGSPAPTATSAVTRRSRSGRTRRRSMSASCARPTSATACAGRSTTVRRAACARCVRRPPSSASGRRSRSWERSITRWPMRSTKRTRSS
jgi:hypothetical protein